MAREVRIVEDRWGTIRHVVESIAIVAAGLWAAYVFIYQERIKPTLEPPSLQETVTFEPGKVVSGVRVAQLHIEFSNTGHVDTDVYAETASVFGDRFDAAGGRRVRISTDPGTLEINRLVPVSKKELIYSYATLRDAAVGGGAHVILRPDQKYAFTIPISVKDERFDELHAEVSIDYGRAYLGRSGFARIALARAADGSLVLKVPKPRREDDGLLDFFSAQTTL
jgi:hypothetical protein